MVFKKGGTKIRKKLIIILTFLLISCFTITTSAEETTNVVCSNSILADFTSNILKDNVTIEYIMPPGVCPAFYDATPSDVSKIISADIVISLGSPLKEPWLAGLLTYNSDCKIIECKDLGEWNFPSGAKKYIEHLTEEISTIFPEKNESIYMNSQLYLTKMEEKGQELLDKIKANNSINKQVICMSWQKEFLEWLDLNVTYSYGPPQGLSVQGELDVINAASNNNIYAVIDNLQSGTDFGARVASESGASHVIFTNFPGAIPGTDTYLEMITYNTEQLIEGIKAYEYKQGDISELQDQITGLELQRNALIILAIIFVIFTITFYIMYKKK